MLVVDVQRGLVEGEGAVPDADTVVAGLAAFLGRDWPWTRNFHSHGWNFRSG